MLSKNVQNTRYIHDSKFSPNKETFFLNLYKSVVYTG